MVHSFRSSHHSALESHRLYERTHTHTRTRIRAHIERIPRVHQCIAAFLCRRIFPYVFLCSFVSFALSRSLHACCFFPQLMFFVAAAAAAVVAAVLPLLLLSWCNECTAYTNGIEPTASTYVFNGTFAYTFWFALWNCRRLRHHRRRRCSRCCWWCFVAPVFACCAVYSTRGEIFFSLLLLCFISFLINFSCGFGCFQFQFVVKR